MTLSDWFRFYVFNMLVKAMTYLLPVRALAPYYGVVGFFVTFFFVGLWHVPTLVLGLSIGLGVSVNRLFQVLMRWRMGSDNYRRLCINSVYRTICHGMTLAYFFVSVTPMWMLPDTFLHEFGALRTTLMISVGFVVLTVISSIAVSLVGTVVHAFLWIRTRLAPVFDNYWIRCGWAGAELFVLSAGAAILASQIPEFIYQQY
jgi:hypothetical protein